jgi:hypothetical protein
MSHWHLAIFPFYSASVFSAFFLAILGFELSASCMYAGAVPLEPLCQAFFVLGFFEIESPELFAWAGLNRDPAPLLISL